MKFFDVFDPMSRQKLRDLAQMLLLKLPSEIFEKLRENIFVLGQKLAEMDGKPVANVVKEWMEMLREGNSDSTVQTEAEVNDELLTRVRNHVFDQSRTAKIMMQSLLNLKFRHQTQRMKKFRSRCRSNSPSCR